MRFFIMIGAATAAIFYSTVGQAQSPVREEWPICGYGKRITCIVDGDTFWMNGQKYRLYGVDAPEAGDKAQCASERGRAREATEYLQSIMRAGGLRFTNRGVDRYDRILVTVQTNQGDAADLLLKNNRAVAYQGGRRDNQQWCRLTSNQ